MAAQTDTTEAAPCTVGHCTRPQEGRGYCNTHRKNYVRWGDPLASRTNHDPAKAAAVAFLLGRPLVSDGDDAKTVGWADLAWQDLGRCAEVDPELFFPTSGPPADAVRQICGSCEVRAECLQYALDHDERWGIWGGLTEDERKAVRKKRQAATAAPEVAA